MSSEVVLVMANTLLLVGTLLLSAFQLARNADGECVSVLSAHKLCPVEFSISMQ